MCMLATELIQQLTLTNHWYHCSRRENPADLITRGLLAERLIERDFSFSGPKYVSDPIFSIKDNNKFSASRESVINIMEDNLIC